MKALYFYKNIRKGTLSDMREKRKCVVISFYTTAEAMATKKLCRQKQIDGRLISAPRAISADCGIAWCSDIEWREKLENALTEADVEYAGIHEITV